MPNPPQAHPRLHPLNEHTQARGNTPRTFVKQSFPFVHPSLIYSIAKISKKQKQNQCKKYTPATPTYHHRVRIEKKYKKRKPTSRSAYSKLVAGIGFEPMTFRLWAWRATWLLNPAIWENGAPRWIWTTNLLIRSQMLYPIELEALKTGHIIGQLIF